LTFSDSFYLACSEVDLDLIFNENSLNHDGSRDDIDVKKWAVQDAFLEDTVNKPESKRRPGLFKLEWAGDSMIALCSKLYHGWNYDQEDFVRWANEPDDTDRFVNPSPNNRKISCKGLNKKANETNLTPDVFTKVLEEKLQMSGRNSGFRVLHGRMYMYKQIRRSLSYFYMKRVVQPDGVSTKPLPGY
jgi:hypothetical protein